jgi:uracil-DNA glycosylase
MINFFSLTSVDPSWHPCLLEALHQMDPDYLKQLHHNQNWLPGPEKIFNAFSLPVNQIHYVLFGESPYPRAASANGYAFWDAAVTQLWSKTGLSKQVNRATSLRNIIKMLLVTEKLLLPHETSQAAIAALDKQRLIQTNEELFNRFLQQGFLLLNASLVLRLGQDQGPGQVLKDARAWQPFLKYILEYLFHKRPHVQLILLGNIANQIDKLIDHFEIKRLYAEHPYNLSFISNPEIQKFFNPLNILIK